MSVLTAWPCWLLLQESVTPHSSNLVDLLLRSSPIAKFILLLLLVFSLASWAIIITKELATRAARQQTEEFLKVFEKSQRLSDLRAAADVMRGRQVKESVRVLVVPGSEAVRREAEAEGLDRVFTDAGAEWRLPGCSMCIAMNGDFVAPGQLAVSTSNRNFEGRQGKGARTILASPATAAASAIAGVLADPRRYLAGGAHA